LFRRLQADHLALRGVWTDAPQMSRREMVLHALRIALINRIWLLETEIPDFSTRFGVSRQALTLRIYRLDVPAALSLLGQIFPVKPDGAADLDYGEPPGPRTAEAYTHEHEAIFEPMRRIFGMIREIGTAITHEVGAFG
jgi:phosphoenolpyruvate carboxylase